MLLAKAVDDGYTEAGYSVQNCDQPMFHDAVLTGTMAVDTASRLVLNLNELGWSDPLALRRVIQADGPAILHGSGRAKSQVRPLWRQLVRLAELIEVPRYEPNRTDPLSRSINSTRGLQDLVRSLPPLGRVAESAASAE